jgi:hypothetical protein
MSTTNSVPGSPLAPAIANQLLTILEQLGVTNVAVTDPQFRLILESTPDGQNLFAQIMQLSGKASLGSGIGSLPLETSNVQGSSGATTGATLPIIPATSMGSAGVQGTLVAGVVTVTMPNKVGDLLAARQVTTGGTTGNYWAAFRASATTVTVHSQTTAGALQAADTSVVEVYNFGNPAN